MKGEVLLGYVTREWEPFRSYLRLPQAEDAAFLTQTSEFARFGILTYPYKVDLQKLKRQTRAGLVLWTWPFSDNSYLSRHIPSKQGRRPESPVMEPSFLQRRPRTARLQDGLCLLPKRSLIGLFIHEPRRCCAQILSTRYGQDT